MELEKAGYISRQKHGRTNLIKLTEKFFKYFDLTEEKLKEQFRDFDSIARAIKEKEEEVEKIVEDQKKRAEDLKHEDEKIKKEIESLDNAGEDFAVPLEEYKTTSKEILSEEFVRQDNLIVEKEKIGELEVVEESQNQLPERRKTAKIRRNAAEPGQDDSAQQAQFTAPEAAVEEAQGKIKENKGQQKTPIFPNHDENKKQDAKTPEQKVRSEGIKMTPELKARVEKRVGEILHGEENKEDKKEEEQQ